MELLIPARQEIAARLAAHGIKPTTQRVEVVYRLYAGGSHLGADELHISLNRADGKISRGTVYNTLNLLVTHGVLREVIVNAGSVIYDVNTEPHHHFYDVDTHELIDVPAEQVSFAHTPSLPPGAELRGVDVIIRIKRGS